jgi:hypothetical protein
MTFDEWWKSKERPETMERAVQSGNDRSYDLGERIMRIAAQAAWDAATKNVKSLADASWEEMQEEMRRRSFTPQMVSIAPPR